MVLVGTTNAMHWHDDGQGARTAAVQAAAVVGDMLSNPARGTPTPSACRMLWDVGETINHIADRLVEQQQQEDALFWVNMIMSIISVVLMAIGPLMNMLSATVLKVVGNVLTAVQQLLTKIATLFTDAAWAKTFAGFAGGAVEGAAVSIALDVTVKEIVFHSKGLTPDFSGEELGTAAATGGAFGGFAGLLPVGKDGLGLATTADHTPPFPFTLPGRGNRPVPTVAEPGAGGVPMPPPLGGTTMKLPPQLGAGRSLATDRPPVTPDPTEPTGSVGQATPPGTKSTGAATPPPATPVGADGAHPATTPSGTPAPGETAPVGAAAPTVSRGYAADSQVAQGVSAKSAAVDTEASGAGPAGTSRPGTETPTAAAGRPRAVTEPAPAARPAPAAKSEAITPAPLARSQPTPTPAAKPEPSATTVPSAKGDPAAEPESSSAHAETSAAAATKPHSAADPASSTGPADGASAAAPKADAVSAGTPVPGGGMSRSDGTTAAGAAAHGTPGVHRPGGAHTEEALAPGAAHNDAPSGSGRTHGTEASSGGAAGRVKQAVRTYLDAIGRHRTAMRSGTREEQAAARATVESTERGAQEAFGAWHGRITHEQAIRDADATLPVALRWLKQHQKQAPQAVRQLALDKQEDQLRQQVNDASDALDHAFETMKATAANLAAAKADAAKIADPTADPPGATTAKAGGTGDPTGATTAKAGGTGDLTGATTAKAGDTRQTGDATSSAAKGADSGGAGGANGATEHPANEPGAGAAKVGADEVATAREDVATAENRLHEKYDEADDLAFRYARDGGGPDRGALGRARRDVHDALDAYVSALARLGRLRAGTGGGTAHLGGGNDGGTPHPGGAEVTRWERRFHDDTAAFDAAYDHGVETLGALHRFLRQGSPSSPREGAPVEPTHPAVPVLVRRFLDAKVAYQDLLHHKVLAAERRLSGAEDTLAAAHRNRAGDDAVTAALDARQHARDARDAAQREYAGLLHDAGGTLVLRPLPKHVPDLTPFQSDRLAAARSRLTETAHDVATAYAAAHRDPHVEHVNGTDLAAVQQARDAYEGAVATTNASFDRAFDTLAALNRPPGKASPPPGPRLVRTRDEFGSALADARGAYDTLAKADRIAVADPSERNAAALDAARRGTIRPFQRLNRAIESHAQAIMSHERGGNGFPGGRRGSAIAGVVGRLLDRSALDSALRTESGYYATLESVRNSLGRHASSDELPATHADVTVSTGPSGGSEPSRGTRGSGGGGPAGAGRGPGAGPSGRGGPGGGGTAARPGGGGSSAGPSGRGAPSFGTAAPGPGRAGGRYGRSERGPADDEAKQGPGPEDENGGLPFGRPDTYQGATVREVSGDGVTALTGVGHTFPDGPSPSPVTRRFDVDLDGTPATVTVTDSVAGFEVRRVEQGLSPTARPPRPVDPAHDLVLPDDLLPPSRPGDTPLADGAVLRGFREAYERALRQSIERGIADRLGDRSQAAVADRLREIGERLDRGMPLDDDQRALLHDLDHAPPTTVADRADPAPPRPAAVDPASPAGGPGRAAPAATVTGAGVRGGGGMRPSGADAPDSVGATADPATVSVRPDGDAAVPVAGVTPSAPGRTAASAAPNAGAAARPPGTDRGWMADVIDRTARGRELTGEQWAALRRDAAERLAHDVDAMAGPTTPTTHRERDATPTVDASPRPGSGATTAGAPHAPAAVPDGTPTDADNPSTPTDTTPAATSAAPIGSPETPAVSTSGHASALPTDSASAPAGPVRVERAVTVLAAGIPRNELPGVPELVRLLREEASRLGVTVPAREWTELPAVLLNNYRYLTAGYVVSLGGMEVKVTLAASDPRAASVDAGTGTLTVGDTTNSQFQTGGHSQGHSGQTGSTRISGGLTLTQAVDGGFGPLRIGASATLTRNRTNRGSSHLADAEKGKVFNTRGPSTLVSLRATWRVAARTDDTPWADRPVRQRTPAARLAVWIPDQVLRDTEHRVSATVAPARLAELPDHFHATQLSGLPELYDAVLATMAAQGHPLPVVGVARRTLRDELWNLDTHLAVAVNEGGFPIDLRDERGRPVARVTVRATRGDTAPVGATSDVAHLENVRTAISGMGGNTDLTDGLDLSAPNVSVVLPGEFGSTLGVGVTTSTSSTDGSSGSRNGLWVVVPRYARHVASYRMGFALSADVSLRGVPDLAAVEPVDATALVSLPEPDAYAAGLPVDAAALPEELRTDGAAYQANVIRETTKPAGTRPAPAHVRAGRGVGQGFVKLAPGGIDALRSGVVDVLRGKGFLPADDTHPFAPDRAGRRPTRMKAKLDNLDLVDRMLSAQGLESHYNAIHQDGMRFTVKRPDGLGGELSATVVVTATQDPESLAYERTTDEYHTVNLPMGMGFAGKAIAGTSRTSYGVNWSGGWEHLKAFLGGLGYFAATSVRQQTTHITNMPGLLEYPGAADVFRTTSRYSARIEYRNPRMFAPVPAAEPGGSADIAGTLHTLPWGSTEPTGDALGTRETTPAHVLDQAVVYHVDASGLTGALADLAGNLTGRRGREAGTLAAFGGTVETHAHFKEIVRGQYTTDAPFEAGLVTTTTAAADISATLRRSDFLDATDDKYVVGLIKLYLVQANSAATEQHGLSLEAKLAPGTTRGELNGLDASLGGTLDLALSGDRSATTSLALTGGTEHIQLDFSRAYLYRTTADFAVRYATEKHGKLRLADYSAEETSVADRTVLYVLSEPEALTRYAAGDLPVPATQLARTLRDWLAGTALGADVVAGALLRWTDVAPDVSPGLAALREAVAHRLRTDHAGYVEADGNTGRDTRPDPAKAIWSPDLRARIAAWRPARGGGSTARRAPVVEPRQPAMPAYLVRGVGEPELLGHVGVRHLSYDDGRTAYDIVKEAIDAVDPKLLAKGTEVWRDGSPLWTWGGVRSRLPFAATDQRMVGRLQTGVDAVQGLLAGGREQALVEELYGPQGLRLQLVRPRGWFLRELVEVHLTVRRTGPPTVTGFTPNSGTENYAHAYRGTGRGAAQAKGLAVLGGLSGGGHGTSEGASWKVGTSGNRGATIGEQNTAEQTAYDWTGRYDVRVPHEFTVRVRRFGGLRLPAVPYVVGLDRYRGMPVPTLRARPAPEPVRVPGTLELQVPRNLVDSVVAGPAALSHLQPLARLPRDAYIHGVVAADALPRLKSVLRRAFRGDPWQRAPKVDAHPTLPALTSQSMLTNHLPYVLGQRYLLDDNLVMPGDVTERARVWMTGEIVDIQVTDRIDDGTGTGRYAKYQSGTTSSSGRNPWSGTGQATFGYDAATAPPLSLAHDRTHTRPQGASHSATENVRDEQHVKQQGPVVVVRVRGTFRYDVERFTRTEHSHEADHLAGARRPGTTYRGEEFSGEASVEMFVDEYEALVAQHAARTETGTYDRAWPSFAGAPTVRTGDLLRAAAGIGVDTRGLVARAGRWLGDRYGHGTPLVLVHLDAAVALARYRAVVEWVRDTAADLASRGQAERAGALTDLVARDLANLAGEPDPVPSTVDEAASAFAVGGLAHRNGAPLEDRVWALPGTRRAADLRRLDDRVTALTVAVNAELPAPAALPPEASLTALDPTYLARDVAYQLGAAVLLRRVGPDDTTELTWISPRGSMYHHDPRHATPAEVAAAARREVDRLDDALRARITAHGVTSGELTALYRTAGRSGLTFEQAVRADLGRRPAPELRRETIRDTVHRPDADGGASEWTVAYDAVWTEDPYGGPPHVTLETRVHLDLSSVPAAERDRFVRRVRDAVDRYFNTGHRLPDGSPLSVSVRFTGPADALHTFTVRPSGPATTTELSVHSGPNEIAHEIGHLLGLDDEYRGAGRNRPAYRDSTLMAGGGLDATGSPAYDAAGGFHAVDPAGRLHPRHLYRWYRRINRGRLPMPVRPGIDALRAAPLGHRRPAHPRTLRYANGVTALVERPTRSRDDATARVDRATRYYPDSWTLDEVRYHVTQAYLDAVRRGTVDAAASGAVRWRGEYGAVWTEGVAENGRIRAFAPSRDQGGARPLPADAPQRPAPTGTALGAGTSGRTVPRAPVTANDAGTSGTGRARRVRFADEPAAVRRPRMLPTAAQAAAALYARIRAHLDQAGVAPWTIRMVAATIERHPARHLLLTQGRDVALRRRIGDDELYAVIVDATRHLDTDGTRYGDVTIPPPLAEPAASFGPPTDLPADKAPRYWTRGGLRDRTRYTFSGTGVVAVSFLDRGAETAEFALVESLLRTNHAGRSAGDTIVLLRAEDGVPVVDGGTVTPDALAAVLDLDLPGPRGEIRLLARTSRMFASRLAELTRRTVVTYVDDVYVAPDPGAVTAVRVVPATDDGPAAVLPGLQFVAGYAGTGLVHGYRLLPPAPGGRRWFPRQVRRVGRHAPTGSATVAPAEVTDLFGDGTLASVEARWRLDRPYHGVDVGDGTVDVELDPVDVRGAPEFSPGVELVLVVHDPVDRSDIEAYARRLATVTGSVVHVPPAGALVDVSPTGHEVGSYFAGDEYGARYWTTVAPPGADPRFVADGLRLRLRRTVQQEAQVAGTALSRAVRERQPRTARPFSYVARPELFAAHGADARTALLAGRHPVPLLPSLATTLPIGLEIEFVFPAYDGDDFAELRERLLAGIRAAMGEEGLLGPDPAPDDAPYSANPDHWRLVPDQSVHGEIVSPLLTGSAVAWANLTRVLAIVRRFGGDIDPRAGGHIHVAVPGLAADGARLTRVVRWLGAYQDVLWRMTSDPHAPPAARRDTHFRTPLPPVPPPIDADQLVRDLSRATRRYPSVNLSGVTVDVRGHLELRFPDGSLDAHVLQARVNLLAAAVEYALGNDGPMPTHQGVGDHVRRGLGQRPASIHPGPAGRMWTVHEPEPSEQTAGVRQLLDTILHREEDLRQAAALYHLTTYVPGPLPADTVAPHRWHGVVPWRVYDDEFAVEWWFGVLPRALPALRQRFRGTPFGLRPLVVGAQTSGPNLLYGDRGLTAEVLARVVTARHDAGELGGIDHVVVLASGFGQGGAVAPAQQLADLTGLPVVATPFPVALASTGALLLGPIPPDRDWPDTRDNPDAWQAGMFRFVPRGVGHAAPVPLGTLGARRLAELPADPHEWETEPFLDPVARDDAVFLAEPDDEAAAPDAVPEQPAQPPAPPSLGGSAADAAATWFDDTLVPDDEDVVRSWEVRFDWSEPGADGRTPYATTSAFTLQELAGPAPSPIRLDVAIHLDTTVLSAAVADEFPLAPAAEVARVVAARRRTTAAAATAAIHRTFDGHRLPNGSPLSVRVRFVAEVLLAHHVVTLHAGGARMDMVNWPVGHPPRGYAHEFGHMIGLLDEYRDAQVAGHRPVYRDATVMGADAVQDGESGPWRLMPRHLRRLFQVLGGRARIVFADGVLARDLRGHVPGTGPAADRSLDDGEAGDAVGADAYSALAAFDVARRGGRATVAHHDGEATVTWHGHLLGSAYASATVSPDADDGAALDAVRASLLAALPDHHGGPWSATVDGHRVEGRLHAATPYPPQWTDDEVRYHVEQALLDAHRRGHHHQVRPGVTRYVGGYGGVRSRIDVRAGEIVAFRPYGTEPASIARQLRPASPTEPPGPARLYRQVLDSLDALGASTAAVRVIAARVATHPDRAALLADGRGADLRHRLGDALLYTIIADATRSLDAVVLRAPAETFGEPAEVDVDGRRRDATPDELRAAVRRTVVGGRTVLWLATGDAAVDAAEEATSRRLAGANLPGLPDELAVFLAYGYDGTPLLGPREIPPTELAGLLHREFPAGRPPLLLAAPASRYYATMLNGRLGVEVIVPVGELYLDATTGVPTAVVRTGGIVLPGALYSMVAESDGEHRLLPPVPDGRHWLPREVRRSGTYRPRDTDRTMARAAVDAGRPDLYTLELTWRQDRPACTPGPAELTEYVVGVEDAAAMLTGAGWRPGTDVALSLSTSGVSRGSANSWQPWVRRWAERLAAYLGAAVHVPPLGTAIDATDDGFALRHLGGAPRVHPSWWTAIAPHAAQRYRIDGTRLRSVASTVAGGAVAHRALTSGARHRAAHPSTPASTSLVANPAAFAALGDRAARQVAAGRSPVPLLDFLASGLPFGLELEFMLAPGLGVDEIRQRRDDIAADLARLGLSAPHGTGEYTDRRDGWQVVEDGSVHGEVVSPLLTPGRSAWLDLATVLAVLTRHGARIDHRCGGHVHVGVGGIARDAARLTTLVRLVEGYQDVLWRLTSDPHASGLVRDAYFRTPTGPVVDHASRDALVWSMSREAGLFPAVNLSGVSPDLRGHIEFRFPDGSLDASVIQARVNLLLALVEYAAHAPSPDLPSYQGIGDHQLRGAFTHPAAQNTDLDGAAWTAWQTEAPEHTLGVRRLLDTVFHRDEDRHQLAALFHVTTWREPQVETVPPADIQPSVTGAIGSATFLSYLDPDSEPLPVGLLDRIAEWSAPGDVVVVGTSWGLELTNGAEALTDERLAVTIAAVAKPHRVLVLATSYGRGGSVAPAQRLADLLDRPVLATEHQVSVARESGAVLLGEFPSGAHSPTGRADIDRWQDGLLEFRPGGGGVPRRVPLGVLGADRLDELPDGRRDWLSAVFGELPADDGGDDWIDEFFQSSTAQFPDPPTTPEFPEMPQLVDLDMTAVPLHSTPADRASSTGTAARSGDLAAGPFDGRRTVIQTMPPSDDDPQRQPLPRFRGFDAGPPPSPARAPDDED
ncbi:hypothetical protein GCM10022220_62130 [Actinocatenispora rupis]